MSIDGSTNFLHIPKKCKEERPGPKRYISFVPRNVLYVIQWGRNLSHFPQYSSIYRRIDRLVGFYMESNNYTTDSSFLCIMCTSKVMSTCLRIGAHHHVFNFQYAEEIVQICRYSLCLSILMPNFKFFLHCFISYCH